jgi:hypothetical protein
MDDFKLYLSTLNPRPKPANQLKQDLQAKWHVDIGIFKRRFSNVTETRCTPWKTNLPIRF